MKKGDDRLPAQVPKKRPRQPRGVFTVKTIYDGFVALWQESGAASVTTRAIAERTGYSVGAIYEYFPNSKAILSGYVRYLMDDLVERLTRESQLNSVEPWRHRLTRLLEITLGLDPEAKYFDRDMLLDEGHIADAKHHRLAFEHLSRAWRAVVRSWEDLPAQPDESTINTLFVTVWGAKRYYLLADIGTDEVDCWLEKLQRMCESLLIERD